MLRIRLRRVGARKRPFFRVVVIESHMPRDGRSIEVLGHYHPAAQPEAFTLNRERLRHWLDRGAQPSDTVRTLLGRHPEETAPTEAVESGTEAAGTEQSAT